MTWKYMHTLNGQPAFFDGDQIVYFPHGGNHRIKSAVLVDSLDQIKEQQKLSRVYREELGFIVKDSECGYIRICR